MTQRFVLALVLLLGGCGGDGSGFGPVGGEGEGEGTGRVGDPCDAANDCAGGLVCDPGASVCAESGDLVCASDEDCGAGAVCREDGSCVRVDPGGACVEDAECPGGSCVGGFCGCGGDMYSAEGLPANVLIAIDRSGSMNDSPTGDEDGDSKWEIAQQAVAQLLASYGDQIRFGLMLWPGEDESCDEGEDCGTGAVFVDVGDGTAQAINDVLSRAGTCSFGTPIGANVQLVAGYAGLTDATRANYLLLVTDGNETCDGDGLAGVTGLRALVPEVRTFVVGFGGEVDRDALGEMAAAGGTARAGDPAYFQADDAVQLEDAFLTIGGSVLSCSYVLDQAPPDDDDLSVYIDREVSPRDATHTEGWDYDSATNQMTFFGATCTGLQDGTAGELLIVYGCPPVGPDGGGPGSCPNGVSACTVGEDCAAGQSCTSGCCVIDSPF